MFIFIGEPYLQVFVYALKLRHGYLLGQDRHAWITTSSRPARRQLNDSPNKPRLTIVVKIDSLRWLTLTGAAWDWERGWIGRCVYRQNYSSITIVSEPKERQTSPKYLYEFKEEWLSKLQLIHLLAPLCLIICILLHQSYTQFCSTYIMLTCLTCCFCVFICKK